MIRYGSPPRWRGWVDGTDASPRRADDRQYVYDVSGGYRNEGSDPNAYAVAVLEKGMQDYRYVLSTTDPASWAWSKPLWAAMFQTASALTDNEASSWAAGQVFTHFADLSSSIPCPLCVQHFNEKLASFPRHNMSRATLSHWVSQLKAEVDERARQRKMGIEQGSPAPASPSYHRQQQQQYPQYQQPAVYAQPQYHYQEAQMQQPPQPVRQAQPYQPVYEQQHNTAYSPGRGGGGYSSPGSPHGGSPGGRTAWAELEV